MEHNQHFLLKMQVDDFVWGSAAHGAHHGRRYNAHSSSGASSDKKTSSGTKVDGQKLKRAAMARLRALAHSVPRLAQQSEPAT